jgi:hypothetical protein
MGRVWDGWRTSRVSLCANGGSGLCWRSDGKEIFYVSQDGRLMAAEVKVNGASLEVGRTQPLFGGLGMSISGNIFDLAPGGQRFLVILPTAQQVAPDPSLSCKTGPQV